MYKSGKTDFKSMLIFQEFTNETTKLQFLSNSVTAFKCCGKE